MKRQVLLFLCFLMTLSRLDAQNRTVTGRVTDETGNPVIGASVQPRGSKAGTTTDASGNFSLNVPGNTKAVTVSSVNFAEQEVVLTNSDNVSVQLKAFAGSLSEVVVVGYQSVRRRDLPGAVSTVSGAELARKPIASFTQALQGKAPGLQITGQSGRPGANAYIRIRGTGSINASSEPLIIIDGISVTTAAYNLLNPNDIEDISVLKDAAATAIYGSRGSNGVLLITTKKGQGQNPTVSYSFQYGRSKAQDLKNVELMSPLQKLQYEFEGGYKNSVVDSMITNRITSGALPAGATLFNLTDEQRNDIWNLAASRGAGDWRNYMLQKGKVVSHEVSVSGAASEKFRYYFSLNKRDEDGVLYGSYFNRVSGRLNIEFNANKWFRMGTNLGVSTSSDNTLRELYNGQALYTSALLLNGYEPLLGSDGQYNYTHLGQNAIETQDRNPSTNKRISTFATVFGELHPITNVTLRSQIGINYNTLSAEYYLQPGSYLAQTLGYNQKRDNGNNDFLYVFTNTANYRQSFGSHNISLLAGTEFTKDKLYSYSLTARGFPSATVNTLENGSTPTATSTSRSDWALISYFASAGYDFSKKYYLTLSGRRDGSSRFGKNNQFANFWAVGGAWNIKNEEFFKFDPISALKIRGSVGTSGNNTGIGNYQALGTYAYNVNYNSQPAASPSVIANPDLTWEQNTNYDLGLEFSLLKSRITGSVDYYNRKTKGLLYNVNLSQTTGFSSYSGNVGSVKNAGFEFVLGGDIIRSKDLVWNITANYTNNNNKILALYSDNVPVTGGISYLTVGQPIYTYYLVKWAGINPANGKNQFYNKDGTTTETYSAGQAQLLDGKSNQVKYFGSINTTINYKGFDASASFYYSGGNYIMNYVYSAGASEGESIGENQFTDALNYWKKPGDISTFSNLKDKTQNATYDIDRYLEKGDYVSLRDVTIGYNVDPRLTDKIKIKSLRVFVQGTNLWLGTKFRGLPETGESNREQTTYTIPGQVTLFSYPQYRAVTVGVNVNF
jgi:TonB-linked SusC/RagA family outer membrane protein